MDKLEDDYRHIHALHTQLCRTLSRPYTRQLLSLATCKHYSSWVLRMEISNATFYKLLENRPPVFFQATCRMYYAIFHAQHARTIKPLMWLLTRSNIPHIQCTKNNFAY